VKELDQPTADLLRVMADIQPELRKSCRLTIWVFHIDGNQQRTKAWLDEQRIAKLNFDVVAADSKELAAWNIDSKARNMLVLVKNRGRRIALATYRDVDAKDLDRLAPEFRELLRRPAAK
jgi:hypothetical protein